jgi:glycosyltransferase involved in cell wall biosynthesis|tara:strand:- start:5617 stop:7305 length:1689 start_codon:yes stop_codon:yes gene_type:complete
MNFKVFFINLEDNPQPWSKAQNLFSLLPNEIKNCLERIDAIDTRKSLNALDDFGLKIDPVGIFYQLYFSQSSGAAGCFLSHYSAWKKIIDEDLDFALIVEDDIVISDLVNFLISNPEIDESLELIQLGARGWDGLEAYLLKNSGASKLISCVKDASLLEDCSPFDFIKHPSDALVKLKKENLDYSWRKIDSITAPADRFVMHVSETLLDYNFFPCIDLCYSSEKESSIYNDKEKPYHLMNYNELSKSINSASFEYWNKNLTTTLCICTYNNYSLLYKCILSALHQSVSVEEYDIIILDNTPTDLIAKSKKEYDKVYELAQKAGNCSYINMITDGLSGARNACMWEAKSDLIYFVDDDTILDSNLISNMVEKFKNPSIGVVGGKIIPDWQIAERPSWLSDEQLGQLSMADFSDRDVFLHEYDKPIWLVGANICFRLDALKKINGFGTHLGRKGGTSTLLSGEEDQAVREIREEYLALYTPDCVVNHIVDPSRLNQSWFVKRVAWQAVSNALVGDLWMRDMDNIKELLKDNVDLLFDYPQDQSKFDLKLKLISIISFLLLDGEI